MNIVPSLLNNRAARFALAIGSTIALASSVLAISAARGDSGFPVLRGTGDLTGSVLDCSTDTVTLSGAYRYTEIGFVKPLSNGTWFSHGSISFNLNGVTGRGASGTSYRVEGATHLDYAFFFGSSSPGVDVEHSSENWQLVPTGGGPPLSFHENFAFVVTPSGSTTLVDHGSGNCS